MIGRDPHRNADSGSERSGSAHGGERAASSRGTPAASHGGRVASKPVILVVDDEQVLRQSLGERLAQAGHRILEAGTGKEALEALGEGVDLAIVDYKLPDIDGLTLLQRIKEREADTLVILMTAYSSVENAVAAMRQGAYDYANKPFHLEEMVLLAEKALETTALRRDVKALVARQAEPYAFARIIGESAVMRTVKALLARIASGPASTVLLMGESGTGKDLAAKALHYNSARAARPFMNITCSAMAETLLESELFGHERGAFTDARQQKKGLLELADGGTVFLDEVADTTPAFQAKLLRFVEERAFKRVGGTVDIGVDVRVIAATNKDLDEAVRVGAFREDLYYRLNVMPVRLPPLRERRGDIPALARYYLEQFSREFKMQIRGISPEAMAALEGHTWAGNVRELRNAIERAMLLCTGDTLVMDEFRMFSPPRRSAGKLQLPAEGIDLAALERELVRQALERTRGNQTQAARLLGMKRDQIRYRVRKLRLEPDPAPAGADVPHEPRRRRSSGG